MKPFIVLCPSCLQGNLETSLIPACVRLAGKGSSVAKGAGQKQICSHISKVLA